MEGKGWFNKVAKIIKNKALPAAATAIGGPVAGAIAGFVLPRLEKRPGGVLPPHVREFLEKHGQEEITSIEVMRTPLDSLTSTALSGLTFGAFDKALKASGYDSAFHLAMVVNGKYMIDKQEVVKVGKPVYKKSTEKQSVSAATPAVNIAQMFEAAEGIMGKNKFTGYDPKNNNCQDFIIAMLKGANALTDEAQTFVKQDIKSVFNKLPGVVKTIARGVTDIAAASNTLIEGQGISGADIKIVGSGSDISIDQRGRGLKKLYKKGKKKGKSLVKKGYSEAKEIVKDDAIPLAKAAAKKLGKQFKLAFKEAKPIRVVLRKGADALANQLNKTNIDALEQAGAYIHNFAHADAELLGKMLGKTIRVASKGAIITGKVASVAGNVMVIVGTVSGQPELVAVGVAMNEAGTALELGGNVGLEVGTLVKASIQGDKKKALQAFLRAVDTFGRGALDMMTEGVGTVFVDLVTAAATGDSELGQQAAARGALVVLGKATGDDAVAQSAVGIAGEAGAAERISGSGLKRTRSMYNPHVQADIFRPEDASAVKRAKGEIAANRETRMNPTNIASAWIEPASATVKDKIGITKSEFAHRPTVRGFGANFVRTGYRESETKEDAIGDTRSTSTHVKALPVPNYKETHNDGYLGELEIKSRKVVEENTDVMETNLDAPLTYQRRTRS